MHFAQSVGLATKTAADLAGGVLCCVQPPLRFLAPQPVDDLDQAGRFCGTVHAGAAAGDPALAVEIVSVGRGLAVWFHHPDDGHHGTGFAQPATDFEFCPLRGFHPQEDDVPRPAHQFGGNHFGDDVVQIADGPHHGSRRAEHLPELASSGGVPVCNQEAAASQFFWWRHGDWFLVVVVVDDGSGRQHRRSLRERAGGGMDFVRKQQAGENLRPAVQVYFM